MKKIWQTTVRAFQLLSWTLSLGLIVYIILFHLYTFITKNQLKFDPHALDRSYLQILVTSSFLIGLIGIMLGKVLKNIGSGNFSTHPLKDKVTFVISSVMLSYFYVNNVFLNSKFALLEFVVLLLFFLYFLPQLINFYQKAAISDYSFLKRFGNHIAIVLLIITGIASITFSFINNRIQSNNKLKSTVYIKEVQPGISTYADKVSLIGYNLGWNTSDHYKLLSDNGPLTPSIWTNDKVEFIVPFSLKEGKRVVWIEKPKDDQANNIVTSNKIPLTIVSRLELYPGTEDNFIIKIVKKIKRYITTNF